MNVLIKTFHCPHNGASIGAACDDTLPISLSNNILLLYDLHFRDTLLSREASILSVSGLLQGNLLARNFLDFDALSSPNSDQRLNLV